MDLFLVGLNHKTAPIAIRERLAFQEAAIPGVFKDLRSDLGFGEALVLSTCNRVEVIAGGSRNGREAEDLAGYLSAYHRIDSALLASHLYSYAGEDLIRHVFRVAASLDSMVVGEAQILGQMKQAFSCAREAGAVGPGLSRLMPHAFFVAKRVRNETRVGRSPVSISSVAVELAIKIFGDLDGRSVLLLGAGKMGELAAQSLLSSGAGQIRVANRTREKADAAAARFKGEAVSFDRLEDALVASDIVIVSTGAQEFVITHDLADSAIRRRRYDPLFLIDISVPRNVDPAVNTIETAFCYDIDDLQSVVETHLDERNQEAQLAEQIVREEVLNFGRGLHRRNAGPVIGLLRQRLEEICLGELQREKESFTDEDYRRAERIILRAAHRIAHPLIQQMKEDRLDPERSTDPLDLIAEAFQLEDKR